MQYSTYKLKNGIKLIHLNSNSPVSHCGIFINVGSRDENDNEQGMAHFLEHVLFKGTKKRKAYHIISSLEDVGGELDAYTTKEKTVIYATFLDKYFSKAFDIISDIVFESNFPEKELEKEKDVILDEINSYLDSPADNIFEEFEKFVYDNHPLGRSILGTETSVKSITKDNLYKFYKKNYTGNKIVLCTIGNIEFNKVKDLFIKYFEKNTQTKTKSTRKPFENYSPFYKIEKKNLHQAHCIIGNLAYDISHKKRLGLILLNNIIASGNMNSRLNLLLREKYGYVYNVESSYNYYNDSGLFYIYFATDKENLNKVYDLTLKELESLKTKKLGIQQLKKAKNQLIGQIAIAADNNLNQMFSYGKSFLLFNKIDSLESVYSKIENISDQDLVDIANEIFDTSKLSTLIYK